MKKILVVDDDPGIREIFRIILEKTGYDIQVRENGQDILENNYDLPDLFLIDKQLTGADGLDICRFLKMHPAAKSIPVIIVSAFPGIGPLARNAGADDYLEKPFDLNYLLKLVQKYIDPDNAPRNF